MRFRTRMLFTLGFGLALALAGCVTVDDDPDESTGAPDDQPDATTTPTGTGVDEDGEDDRDAADGDGQGQGQGQDQGQGQTVNQNQTVIVNVGPTPTAPAPTTASPPPTTASPTPTPPPNDDGDQPPLVWPRAGSHVTYEVTWHDVDGQTVTQTTARAEWTHDGSDWRGACTATARTQAADGSTETRTQSTTYTASDPPHWPLFNTRQVPHVGGPIDTWHLHVCAIVSGHHQYAGETVTTWDERNVMAYVAVETDAQRDEKDFRTEWDQRTGLVLDWDLRESDGDRLVGELTSTDAPLAWR